MSGFSLTHTYRACSMELENWLCCSILRFLLFLADSFFRCLISYLCCLHLGPTGAYSHGERVKAPCASVAAAAADPHG